MSRASLRCSFLLLALVLSCADPVAPPLRLGVSQWPPYEFLRLARHQANAPFPSGIQLVDFFTPVDLLKAYQLGQVDAMACTLAEFLYILEEGGRDPVIIGIIDASRGADVVLGPDSLAGPEDLRGLRIGVEEGTVGEVLLAGALEAGGLSPQEVRRVPFHLQLDRGPLAENELDAVVCFPPFSTALMRQGGLKPLFDSAQLASPLFDVLVVERSWLLERSGDLAQLLRAFHEALRLREQRKPWADSLMATWEGSSVEEFRQAFTGFKLYTLEEQAALLAKELPASLQHTHALLVLQERLKNPLPAPPSTISDQVAREALSGR